MWLVRAEDRSCVMKGLWIRTMRCVGVCMCVLFFSLERNQGICRGNVGSAWWLGTGWTSTPRNSPPSWSTAETRWTHYRSGHLLITSAPEHRDAQEGIKTRLYFITQRNRQQLLSPHGCVICVSAFWVRVPALCHINQPEKILQILRSSNNHLLRGRDGKIWMEFRVDRCSNKRQPVKLERERIN